MKLLETEKSYREKMEWLNGYLGDSWVNYKSVDNSYSISQTRIDQNLESDWSQMVYWGN